MPENLFSSPMFLWIIVIILSAIVEASTIQLVTIWFAIGGIASLIAEAAGASFTVQIILFFALSLLLLIFTRPICKKLMKNNNADLAKNQISGKLAIVTQKIDPTNKTGRVKLDDVNWKAESLDNSVIEEGERVIVKKTHGTTLIVEKSV